MLRTKQKSVVILFFIGIHVCSVQIVYISKTSSLFARGSEDLEFQSSLAQSLAQSLAHSIAQSLAHSLAQSLAQSLAHIKSTEKDCIELPFTSDPLKVIVLLAHQSYCKQLQWKYIYNGIVMNAVLNLFFIPGKCYIINLHLTNN